MIDASVLCVRRSQKKEGVSLHPLHHFLTMTKCFFVLLFLVVLPATTHAFVPQSPIHIGNLVESWSLPVISTTEMLALSNNNVDWTIGAWAFAFASSHIGMSATRNTLIQSIGDIADRSIVGRGWTLPDIWPGDESGQEIFPTAEIAGRQLYRVLYTAVSFTTLGSAFAAYLTSLHEVHPVLHDSEVLHWIAALSWGCSIASLFNPSPLSLVPVFNQEESAVVRNDSQKLQASGMTRITRHPLILPVAPWAIATAFSIGGMERDLSLFGILALYSVAGCIAQDLRILRQEGSVGTVFIPDESLQDFFQQTSFIPFRAVLDGRQSLVVILQEVPWLALLVGSLVGYKGQEVLLEWLVNQ